MIEAGEQVICIIIVKAVVQFPAFKVPNQPGSSTAHQLAGEMQAPI
ncbi:hypothetical protein I3842_03G046000 [Carya illinoinensis]|uniref:Uncharacterized protein n=1 Tax=Carya illinoinensis TaxID=32201 RepID=A0A922JTL0_CARIL|nr:hypothetical protein I3842_03G046000 [Carya illinoinensis]